MTPEQAQALLKLLKDDTASSVAELQEILQQKALKQKLSGRWIALIALLIGITYMAFQDPVTIVVISDLIVMGISFLLRRESREIKTMILSDDEALELFEMIQRDRSTE